MNTIEFGGIDQVTDSYNRPAAPYYGILHPNIWNPSAKFRNNDIDTTNRESQVNWFYCCSPPVFHVRVGSLLLSGHFLAITESAGIHSNNPNND